MPTNEYKWPSCISLAAMGGLIACFIAMLFNVAINAISPVRIPLWVTTILSLILITYWLVGDERADGYISKRIMLSVAYLIPVIVIAVAVRWFIESAFPDRKFDSVNAVNGSCRQFPFWASMVLTWVFLAHGELRDVSARERQESDRL
jgi:uncharacterized membrane protein (GlpM family)